MSSPGLRTLLDRVTRAHLDRFGVAPEVVVHASARANLIGEHVDRFGGDVRPSASIPFLIDRHLAVAMSRSSDPEAELLSLDETAAARFPLGEPCSSLGWDRFPKAVALELLHRGVALRGFRGVLASDIPGRGLASSAALVVALCDALTRLSGEVCAPEELVDTAWRAELRTGTPCGALDQMVAVHGRGAGALVVHFHRTKPPAFEPVVFQLGPLGLLCVDTGRSRELARSRYPERVQEGEQALQMFQAFRRARSEVVPSGLSELSISEIDAMASFDELRRTEAPMTPASGAGALSPERLQVLMKRARHVVTECDRVERMLRLLAEPDMEARVAIGPLLTECHRSLRDDFEVSCPELDFLVDTALGLGAIGARLMGAGEGGNMIVLADRRALPDLQEHLFGQYRAQFPERSPRAFVL